MGEKQIGKNVGKKIWFKRKSKELGVVVTLRGEMGRLSNSWGKRQWIRRLSSPSFTSISPQTTIWFWETQRFHALMGSKKIFLYQKYSKTLYFQIDLPELSKLWASKIWPITHGSRSSFWTCTLGAGLNVKKISKSIYQVHSIKRDKGMELVVDRKYL